MILLESNITTFDLFNLIASLTSIVLAIFALVLSIVFYRWADKSNKEIVSVAQAIDNNTKKIENLFDRLYNDTFGMMKSNVEAMQKQLYGFSMSSGDSSLKEPEILEEAIITIVAKSKVVTKESICVYIQKLYPKNNYTEGAIFAAMEKLVEKGNIYVNQNLITIGNTQSKTEQSS